MITLTKQELKEYLDSNNNSLTFAHLALSVMDENPDEALSLCENHLQNHPDYGFGYFVKGYLLYKKEDYTGALENLEMATLLNPSIIKAWELKQAIYSQLGDEGGLKITNAFISVWQETQTVEEEFSFGETDLLEEIEDLSEEAEKLELEDQLISEDELLGDLENAIEPETQPEIAQPELEAEPELPENPEEEVSEPLEKSETPETLETTENEAIENLDFTSSQADEQLEELLEEIPDSETIPESSVVEEEEKQQEEFPEEEAEPGEESEHTGESEPIKDKVEEEILSEFQEDILAEEKIVDMETEQSSQVQDQVEQEISESLGDFEVNTATESDLGIAKSESESGETKVVTSTLGEIYIAQGKFREALEVFQTLLQENPENRRYKRKVKELQELLQQNQ